METEKLKIFHGRKQPAQFFLRRSFYPKTFQSDRGLAVTTFSSCISHLIGCKTVKIQEISRFYEKHCSNNKWITWEMLKLKLAINTRSCLWKDVFSISNMSNFLSSAFKEIFTKILMHPLEFCWADAIFTADGMKSQ